MASPNGSVRRGHDSVPAARVTRTTSSSGVGSAVGEPVGEEIGRGGIGATRSRPGRSGRVGDRCRGRRRGRLGRRRRGLPGVSVAVVVDVGFGVGFGGKSGLAAECSLAMPARAMPEQRPRRCRRPVADRPTLKPGACPVVATVASISAQSLRRRPGPGLETAAYTGSVSGRRRRVGGRARLDAPRRCWCPRRRWRPCAASDVGADAVRASAVAAALGGRQLEAGGGRRAVVIDMMPSRSPGWRISRSFHSPGAGRCSRARSGTARCSAGRYPIAVSRPATGIDSTRARSRRP